ncbi:DNA recombination protein RmuC [Patescibacteria group bacterium]|nr:DNA recombination protein RmuC [Patescibacteria group bacterium]
MSNTTLLILCLFLISILATFYFLLKKLLSEKNSEQSSEQLEDMVHKVFGMASNEIAIQSKGILQGEKDLIKNDLSNKQAAIEKMIRELRQEMGDQQREIRAIEKDQIDKISGVKTAVEEHRQLTKELKISTEQLAKVLSNNQTRGAWGERIIEDLLQANGLQEGIHYLRQAKLGDSEMKPDITLLLPDHRNVAVDVKFPYQEVQKMSMTEDQGEKQSHVLQFKRDLKIKVDKVATYISPENDTLDYAIMFVPNEALFSFINQKFPDVIDEALAKKVIICSPFSFLIVARTVMESYRNFMVGKKIKQVIKHIDAFASEWLKFDDEFSKFGRSIETLQKNYETLSTTRKRQMEKKIQKIEQYRGSSVELLEDGKKVELIEA